MNRKMASSSRRPCLKRYLQYILVASITLSIINMLLSNHRILVSIKINYPSFLMSNNNDLPPIVDTQNNKAPPVSKTVTTIAPASVAETLSQPELFFPKITQLYKKYGHEIAAFRPEMREWCKRVKNCKFCDYEAEMIYILIREHKPQKVFELATTSLGYTSHWILHALLKNDETSKLHSFGIHPNTKKNINPQYRNRFKGTQGSYEKQFDAGLIVMDGYDFIVIDASTDAAFVRGYCKRLLLPHKRKAVVAVHDIVSNNMSVGGPSELFKHILVNDNIHNIFTMSSKFMPNIAEPIVGAVTKLNEIRVEHGIIKPCSASSSCGNASYDPLYITTNDSPTLFFELN